MMAKVKSNRVTDLFPEGLASNKTSAHKSKHRGPPNRMNDLTYRDWMKFQKSFFWHKSDAHLYSELIQFFTKELLPDNSPSRSLIRGTLTRDALELDDRRKIDVGSTLSGNELANSNAICGTTERPNCVYDFVVLDLRDSLRDRVSIVKFLKDGAQTFFNELRKLLVPDKYCVILVPACAGIGKPFPIAWAFADAGRSVMRLRDEKIALSKDNCRNIFYCTIFQNNKDERQPTELNPESLVVSDRLTKFKTWIIPKPPPRKKNELLHPAKFPETLVQEFIEFFTEPGNTVLDPMAGTGSTIIAALRSGRNAVGVELIEQWVEIAQDRINREFQPTLFDSIDKPAEGRIICADAKDTNLISDIVDESIDYLITSPPYWSILRNPGSENQRARRMKKLSLVYSDNDNDLGNVQDYDDFLNLLSDIYVSTARVLKPGAVMTVIVKNVKRNHVVYPLAWDLVAKLCTREGKFEYLGDTLWCQDDIGLKPFGVGIVWVSNIVHQYCLHFRRR